MRGTKLIAIGMMSSVSVVFKLSTSATSRHRPTLNKVDAFKMIDRAAMIDERCASYNWLAMSCTFVRATAMVRTISASHIPTKNEVNGNDCIVIAIHNADPDIRAHVVNLTVGFIFSTFFIVPISAPAAVSKATIVR